MTLTTFAHGAELREAWNWWNRNFKSLPHVGVFHEAYDIPTHHWGASVLADAEAWSRCDQDPGGEWRGGRGLLPTLERAFGGPLPVVWAGMRASCMTMTHKNE